MIDIGSYNTLFRVGDKLENKLNESPYPFGSLVNQKMKPLLEKLPNHLMEKRISNSPDFSSLIRGYKDQQLYMITHFEDVPGGMYLTLLKQKKNGKLIPKKTRPLDFSKLNGGWVHCAGSVTPWGTHLGSEEYEPNAADPNLETSRYFSAMQAYFQDNHLKNTRVNPYDYGFVIEVKVNNYTDTYVSKQLAMGRFSVELAYVMPDQRTVYMSDDGTDAASPGTMLAQ